MMRFTKRNKKNDDHRHDDDDDGDGGVGVGGAEFRNTTVTTTSASSQQQQQQRQHNDHDHQQLQQQHIATTTTNNNDKMTSDRIRSNNKKKSEEEDANNTNNKINIIKKKTPKMITSSKELPSTGGFASNHVMVNVTREYFGLGPLIRSPKLDKMAKKHAELMSTKCEVFHSASDLDELGTYLKCDVVGENVQRGYSVHEMHNAALQAQTTIMGNLADPRFTEFGMGTRYNEHDRKIYMCQLFRGRENNNNSNSKG